MKARVVVTLKNGVLDPQGKAIEGALRGQDLPQIHDIRQGKVFDLVVDAASVEEARPLVEKACATLLANTVIESYTITFA
jgi:phosphoribosylformylglycinamidine synthase subunit PurS